MAPLQARACPEKVMQHPNLALKKASGFSLVEAMVAMLVLSIGMLGIAALYVESLRSGRSALARTQAIMLVTDMADRIRANSSVVNNYAKAANTAGTLSVACNGGTGTCTPANMAANDIAIWHSMVDDRADNPASGQLGLPNGRGTITISIGPPRIVTVSPLVTISSTIGFVQPLR